VGGEVRNASIGEDRRLNQILPYNEEHSTYVCRPVFLSYFFTDLPPHSSISNASTMNSPCLTSVALTIRFPRQFQPDGQLWHRKSQPSIGGLPRRCPTVRLDAEVEGSKASEVILTKAIDGSVTSANEAEARKTRRTRAWRFARQAKFRPRHKCLFWHPSAKAIKALILL
jgi:hypothetical protein